MNLQRAWPQFRDSTRARRLLAPRFVSRVRGLCCLGVIASVMAAALSTPAPAQEATPERAVTPAPAQEATPDRAVTPAPAQEATPERAVTPAPAQEATPERAVTPAPAQEATPERAATPAPAEAATPDRAVPPAPAPARKGTPAREQEPDHIRGQIAKVERSAIEVRTRDGKTVRLGLLDPLTVISLAKGSFTAVDFGVYVGAVAVRLEAYSPIVRDSLSWLHKGFELRIIDEQLRGIALGHKKWDLTSETIIAHGWIDDIEGRVISIKWGPTEEEETDVETPRDAPVLKMALGDKSLIKPGAHVFAGAQQDGNGRYVAVFIIVGKDGIVPPL